jgi:hypothetical protein
MGESEQAILWAIRAWGSLEQLTEFALQRHGFGNSDVGCGVIYPDDLDPDERATHPIPDGSVQVYEGGGLPDAREFFVPEVTYLERLADELVRHGAHEAAAQIRALRQRLTD